MWASHDLLPTPGPPVPLREATPYGQVPNYLMRDRDHKFGSRFARVAATSGIKMLITPYHAKRPNAICERFLLSVRRECVWFNDIMTAESTPHRDQASKC
jgi:transposase InsO family protein